MYTQYNYNNPYQNYNYFSRENNNVNGIDLRCYETLDAMDDEPTSGGQETLVNENIAKDEMDLISDESTTSSSQVKVCKLEEIKEFFTNNAGNSPLERVEKLKSFFSYIPEEEDAKPYWNLWLEVTNSIGSTVFIDLIIEEDEYDSQCFPQSSLCIEIPEKSIFIKAVEENNNNNYYFQVRIDPCSAEILHIQKGDSLSGTDVKKLSLMFLDYIQPRYAYLHDDAKIEHLNKEMALRIFLPIVSDTPETWYSKDGFFPLDYVTLADPEGNPRNPQNYEKYISSVDTIRSTLLKQLLPNIRPLFAFPNSTKIKQWISFYVKNSPTTINLNNCTVHTLARSMYNASRNKNDEKLANKARKDFLEFYRFFLSESQDFFPKNYRDGLNVLNEYQLWYKG